MDIFFPHSALAKNSNAHLLGPTFRAPPAGVLLRRFVTTYIGSLYTYRRNAVMSPRCLYSFSIRKICIPVHTAISYAMLVSMLPRCRAGPRRGAGEIAYECVDSQSWEHTGLTCDSRKHEPPRISRLSSNVAYDTGLSGLCYITQACGVDRSLPVNDFSPVMFASAEPSRGEAPSHQQRYEAFALTAELALKVPNSFDSDTVSKNRKYAPLYMRPRSSDCDRVWPSPVSLSRRPQPQPLYSSTTRHPARLRMGRSFSSGQEQKYRGTYATVS